MPYIKYSHEPSEKFWKSIWTELNPDVKVLTISTQDDPLIKSIRNRLKRKSRILDAGCGIGQWTIYLKQQDYDVVGLDFEPETISRLIQKYPDIEWKLGDVLHIPFEDNSFDAYLSLGVLEHLRGGFLKGIREAKRVLKSDGMLFLSVPYYSTLRRVFRSYSQHQENLPFYQYYFGERELVRALEYQGFKISSIFKADAIWGFLGEFRYIAFLYLMLQKRIFPKPKIIRKNRSITQSNLYWILKTLHEPLNNSNFLLRFCAHRICVVATLSN